MLGRSNRKERQSNHIHDFRNHNVGANLQRQVCRGCGHISINPLPPADLRTEILEVKTGLFTNSELTVGVAEAIESVLSPSGFGRRRNQR